MRVLIVGAGATGGYFGGRMLQAGRDVTFLVRPGRAAQLEANGLQITSPHGDVTLQPRFVTAGALTPSYDVVLLSVKAYALGSAIDDLSPVITGNTFIMPVLNGMRHMDRLIDRFGSAAVIGGVCIIASMTDPAGRIVQLAPMQELSYGECDGSVTARIEALDAVMQGCGFTARASSTILQAMWEKWTFLATLGGLTCLMRGTIGDIIAAPGGLMLAEAMLAECSSVATADGFPPSGPFMTRITGMVTAAGSPLTSSMYRDLIANAPVEADQILGDMLVRAQRHNLKMPLLSAAFAQLSIYQTSIPKR